MSILSFADWLAKTPQWLQSSPEWLQNFVFQLYQTFIHADRWKFFTDGLKITFIVTIGALLMGVVIGLLIAIIRTSHDLSQKKPFLLLRILNTISNIYLTVIRGTPMMVQLLIMGFVIMVPKTEFGTIMCGIITLGINSGAYVAEIARSGIMSIDKGQMEAARSLGLPYWRSMQKVVLPQAIRTMIPSIINQFIITLKDTSILSVIGFPELVNSAKNVIAINFQSFQVWAIVAVMYLIVITALSKLAVVVERRLNRGR